MALPMVTRLPTRQPNTDADPVSLDVSAWVRQAMTDPMVIASVTVMPAEGRLPVAGDLQALAPAILNGGLQVGFTLIGGLGGHDYEILLTVASVAGRCKAWRVSSFVSL